MVVSSCFGHVFATAGWHQPLRGDAVAWGSFTDVINKTGWAVLDVHTEASANGDTQSYAAGFLEGALTHERITQHLQNMPLFMRFQTFSEAKVDVFMV